MKKIIIIIIIFVSFFNTHSFAQENVVSKVFGNASMGVFDSSYHKIYASYGFSHVTANYCSQWELRELLKNEGKTLHGEIMGHTASIGYIYGLKIAENIYLEIGPQFDLSNYSIKNPSSDFDSYMGYIEDGDIESKCKGLAINIPINLLYRIEIENSFSISPFIGYNNKIQIQNLDGLLKNRYNPGVNIGFSIDFKYYSIGYKYTKDIFSAFEDNVKLNNHYISIGYTLLKM